jgi:hypothetical protein
MSVLFLKMLGNEGDFVTVSEAAAGAASASPKERLGAGSVETDVGIVEMLVALASSLGASVIGTQVGAEVETYAVDVTGSWVTGACNSETGAAVSWVAGALGASGSVG